MGKKYDTIYEEALETWGTSLQIGMVAEEATELATAALHVLRGRDALDELAEEAADLEIMLAQLRVLMAENIDEHKTRKLQRLRKTLDGFNGSWRTTEEDVKRITG